MSTSFASRISWRRRFGGRMGSRWQLSLASATLTGFVGLGVAHAAPPEAETEQVPAETDPEAGTQTGAEAAPALPEGFVPASLQNEVTVRYPEALAEGEAPRGSVEVTFVVGSDGVPKELELTQALHPDLDAIALDAVAQLRYTAATYQDEAVEVVLSIRLDFAPPEPEPEPEPEVDPDIEPEVDPDIEPRIDPDTPDTDNGPIRVEGRVLTAGDRTPVVGATVLAIPADGLPAGRVKKRIYDDGAKPAWTARATTDTQGSFALRGVPDGLARLIVIAPDYERFEYVVPVRAGQVADVKWYVKPLADNPFRTTVEVDREEMVEVTQRSITMEEIGRLPGTQGDALKAIANFPGVARPPFAGGLLVIRGSAPEDSAVFLGYHEIPTLFHFGGITSVFNADILAQIDFIPGNFDSRYGDAIGGIINVAPRKGRRDGYHGYVDSDLFDTGVLVEGKVGKGSFALAGRRSYIDFLLPVFLPSDIGLSFTLAPRYYDYQGLFDYPVGKDGEISVRAFGSDDRTVLAFSSPNDEESDARNSVESVQWFHRADLVYRARKNNWDFLVTPSYRKTLIDVAAVDVFELTLDIDTFSARAEVSNRLSKRARIRFGTEFVGNFTSIRVDAPAFAGVGQQVQSTRANVVAPALYSTATLAVTPKLNIYPGVRVTSYAGLLEQVTVDPRLRFAWAPLEKTRVTGGIGIYSQSPQPVELSDVFGNPNLGPEQSLHLSLGVRQDLPLDFNVEVTGFYKQLWDQVFSSQRLVLRDQTLTPEFFANSGNGRIYGMEFLLRRKFSKKFFGWASYTLSRSERQEQPGQSYRLFDFDQTHILTLIASYKLPQNWQIGARFRLVSGNPFTDCTDGIFDASAGQYECRLGPANGSRSTPFHQLDLRVDKSWIYKWWNLTLYLDIQNAYNNMGNVEFQNYSFNFQANQPITSLPIIPSLGLKAAF